ncbi:MAG: MCE family protein [Verrucomicrobiaceae bacterium]|nr:MCE family protein [Verrucomicrobiaceae bacterium]
MEERDKKTELLVGLFLFVGMLLLAGLILKFSSIRELMKEKYEITAPFPDASGVKVGTPIMLGGSKIGKVPRMPTLNAQFNGVIVPMEIYADNRIPKDAKFAIGTAGLLGDSFIEIKPSGKKTESYFEPGTAVGESSVDSGGGLSALTSTADKVGKQADEVLVEIKAAAVELKGTIGRLNEGALSDDTLKHFRQSMENLDKAVANVSDKIVGDENADNLKQAIADVKDAAASFKDTASSLKTTSLQLGETLKKLDPAVGKADKVMTSLDEALVSFKGASDNLAELTKTFGKGGGKGLLPALMNDEVLKEDFKDLISNFKRNGVLFYRDNADKLEAEQKTRQQQTPPPSQRRGIFGR